MLQDVFGKLYKQIKKNTMLQDVFAKLYKQIKKNTMMTLSWRHFMCLKFENLNFVKQYMLPSFISFSCLDQILWRLV